MPRFAPFVVGVLLSLVVAAPAAADAIPASVTWSSGASLGSHYGGLGCTSVTFCTLNDAEALFTLKHPLSRAARVKRVRLGAAIEPWTVMCDGTPLLCLAGTRDNRIVASTHPTTGRHAFHTVGRISQGVSNARCDGTFCAVGGAGGFAFSNTPMKAGSWVRRSAPKLADSQVAYCSSTGTCITTWGRFLWTIGRPEVTSNRWRFTFLHTRGELMDGDCVGSACIVPTRGGQVFVNADVTNDSSAWTATDLGQLWLGGITCDSITRCYALAAKPGRHGDPTNPRYLLYSNTAFDAAPVWYSARVPTPGTTGAYDYSCPTAETCLVELDTPGRRHTVKARLAVAHLPAG